MKNLKYSRKNYLDSLNLVSCQCGKCNEMIPVLNKMGRPAKYKHGHNPTKMNQKGEIHPYWKGGKRLNSYGYSMIYKPEHPYADKHGYIFEHRYIMEQHIGRYLSRDELVHHINENILDNKIENLQLVSRGEHAIIHNILEPYQFKIGHKTRLGKYKTK